MIQDLLKDKWLTEQFNEQKGLLITQIDGQMSLQGMMLDLNSLPTEPIPFKELFIRWLLEVNKDRIKQKMRVIVTYSLITQCPLWKLVKAPIKKIQLTQEGMFNKPSTIANKPMIGFKPKIGSLNSKQNK